MKKREKTEVGGKFVVLLLWGKFIWPRNPYRKKGHTMKLMGQ